MDNLGDATLLKLISRGNEQALGELYDRYNRLVFGIALEFTHDRDLAEEIMQEVFTRVWQKADTYRANRGEVKVWLSSLTRYRAIDLLRKRNARPAGHSIDLAAVSFNLTANTQNPEAAAARALRLQRLRQELADLPEEQRQALALAYFRGMSHSEIAEATDTPLGTVKTRIRSAIKKLRRALYDVK